jgi:tetratricopeptide (TPR) repeat protein
MKQLRTWQFLCGLILLLAPVANLHAQTEGVVIWQVTRFDITVTLPATGTTDRAMTAHANITARNIGSGIGRTFTVRFNPATEIKTVTVGDATATFTKATDARSKLPTAQINLPSSFPPNSTLNVAIDYRLPLTGQNTGLAAISPEGSQFLPLSFWYPAPNTPYAPRGADYAPVRLTVNAPGGETVISSGPASNTTFEQKLNAQPFFLTGKWDTVEGSGDARGVSAYMLGGGADERRQAEQLIALAAAARTFYASLLGPAPDAPIRLVAVHRGAGFDMGGTVLLEAAAFRRNKPDATSALAIGEAVAHLWLGGATPINGEGAGVLREGLGRYLATLFLEKQFGRDAAEAERLRERIAYTAIAKRDAPLAITTPLDPTYFTSVADKGAMVWRLMEHSLGRDAFVGLLRAQLQAAGDNGLTLATLRTALNERGAALQALLAAQLDQPTETDLLIGVPQQRGGEWVSALRNTSAQDVSVRVSATTDAGQTITTDVTIPARDFGEAHFKTTAKLVRVEVDPEKLYPQIDYANDIAPREPGLDEALDAATRALGAGDYAKAEANARTMLQVAPLMQEARILLARALLDENRSADAEREFRVALDDKLPLPATLAWGAYGLAEIAARKGQTAEAVRLYTEAIRAEGGYPPTLAARAARLKVEGANAPAPDDAVKQFMTQLDQAIHGGHKAEIDPLVVPGELVNFTKGFIAIQPEIWQTRVLRTETIGDRIAADVSITAKAEGRDKTITAVYLLTRTGGALRLAEIPIFEEH